MNKKKKNANKEPPPSATLTREMKWLMAGFLVAVALFLIGAQWLKHYWHQRQQIAQFQSTWKLSDAQMDEAMRQKSLHEKRYTEVSKPYQQNRQLLLERKAAGAPKDEIETLMARVDAEAEKCWQEEMSYIGIVAGLMPLEEGKSFREPYERRHNARKRDAEGVLYRPHAESPH